MKVAIIGPAFPLRGGGMSTFNERLARAFQESGHEVIIYTFSLQYPSFLFPGTTQYSTEAAPTDLNIKVCINSVNPLNWISVGNKIKKDKPDLVVVRYWLPFMGPCLGTILRQIKKNKHSKIICIADNIIPHERRPGDKIFTKYFVKPVDAFITMSAQVKSDLKKFAPTKTAKLVSHPLYDNFGEKIAQSEAQSLLSLEHNIFTMLFFGFIRTYKGLDILLDAMPKVLVRIPAARLIIAGEFYGDSKMYLQKIQDLKLEDNIILHTLFIEDQKIKTFFCATDVVIQPYRSATQSGVTPLAYHFDIPMIVTNVGGLQEMVPHGVAGLVAEPNADDLAEKIIEYHALGKNYFSEGLKKEKSKLSWDVFLKEILELTA